MSKFPSVKAVFGYAILSSLLISCGSSSAHDFIGTWDGKLSDLTNNCPFTTASELNNLFPMTVTEGENAVITVQGANGDVATGGQGIGETISFSASSPQFGDYGTTLPFICDPSLSTVAYLTKTDTEADVSVTITFQNCSSDGGQTVVSNCSQVYRGDAVRR